MDLGAILLILAVLVGVVLFVGRPLMTRFRMTAHQDQELSALQAKHESILTALQELDFDNSLDKVPAEDFSIQRAELLQHGAEVLRRLDALQGRPAAITEARGEAASASRRHKKALTDDDLEDLIANRRRVVKQKAGGFCPQCGKPVLQSDSFCPACGAKLA
ncbi:MAG: zinc ribbon domain-containing protein [Anaerolineales bacterium]|nr:zinc ribbon domain-containing protein [Anaerolineales bacterium]